MWRSSLLPALLSGRTWWLGGGKRQEACGQSSLLARLLHLAPRLRVCVPHPRALPSWDHDLAAASSKLMTSPPDSHASSTPLSRAQARILLDQLEPCPAANKAQIQFLMYQQTFLELLEAGNIREALITLRGLITPLGIRRDRVHELSGLVMVGDPKLLRSTANWAGSSAAARRALLLEIERFVSPSIMVPHRRLQTLVSQALRLQRRDCLYHNTADATVSLLVDHRCTREVVPRHTEVILKLHDDEVWFVSYSHDGQRLATASKDTRVIIWSQGTGNEGYKVLAGHTDAVCYVAWSPDDARLLSCGSDTDHSIRMWDTATGVCQQVFSSHQDGVTTVAWHPNGRQFVSGSSDQSLLVWQIDGTISHRWGNVRTSELAINSAGTKVVVACLDRKVGRLAPQRLGTSKGAELAPGAGSRRPPTPVSF